MIAARSISILLLAAACGSSHRREVDSGVDAGHPLADAAIDAAVDAAVEPEPDSGAPGCVRGDGTPAATPAAIDCGGKSCTPGAAFCCRTGSDADGTLLGSCLGPGANCGGWHLDCDDDVDCAAGAICCNAYDAEVGGFRSRCVAPDAAPAVCGDPLETFHVCTCTAQCGAGETCQPLYTEVGEFSACGLE